MKFFCRFGKSEVVLRTVRIGDKKLTDIKWFKFDPHTFDTAQMRYLGGAHERGALYQLVWVKLLCEAAKCGDGGRIYIFKGRVITTRELSVIFGMDEDTVAMAVCLLTDMGLLKYDGESGLVVRDFSDYLGEGYLGAVREEEPAEDCLDTEDEEAELSEEEIKRERNREAQRRWRERNKQKKAANKENGVILRGGNSNNSVTQSEKNRNESVIISNSERNCTVIERNTERNESNTDCVISPPKNIFIEEKRIEESRIEDKRKEEIRKEETNNNFSRSLPKASLREGGGPSLTVEGACEMHSIPLGNGYENKATRDLPQSPSVPAPSRKEPPGRGCEMYSLSQGNENESEADISPQGAPPPAHAEEKEREEIRSYYGIFNNVYLSGSELTRLKAEFGDILTELIEDLSCAMESDGRSYNNHFATLLRWGKNKYAPKRRATPSGGAGGNGGNGGVGGKGENGGDGYNRNDSSYDGFAAFSSESSGAGGKGDNGGVGGKGYNGGDKDYNGGAGGNGGNGGAGGNGGNGGYYSRGGENAGGNYGQDSGAQKKNSYRSGYEPIRNLTREEAEEAFRRALERTAAGG